MIKIPKIDEIDCSGLPNPQIARSVIEQLLQGFSNLPIGARVGSLEFRQGRRAHYVEFVLRLLNRHPDITASDTKDSVEI